jgi:hypothetical protein
MLEVNNAPISEKFPTMSVVEPITRCHRLRCMKPTPFRSIRLTLHAAARSVEISTCDNILNEIDVAPLVDEPPLREVVIIRIYCKYFGRIPIRGGERFSWITTASHVTPIREEEAPSVNILDVVVLPI